MTTRGYDPNSDPARIARDNDATLPRQNKRLERVINIDGQREGQPVDLEQYTAFHHGMVTLRAAAAELHGIAADVFVARVVQKPATTTPNRLTGSGAQPTLTPGAKVLTVYREAEVDEDRVQEVEDWNLPGGGQEVPDGTVGLLVVGTEENVENKLFCPIFTGLTSHNHPFENNPDGEDSENPPKMSTVVTDPNGDEPLQALLNQGLFVVRVPERIKPKDGEGNDFTTLAANAVVLRQGDTEAINGLGAVVFDDDNFNSPVGTAYMPFTLFGPFSLGKGIRDEHQWGSTDDGIHVPLQNERLTTRFGPGPTLDDAYAPIHFLNEYKQPETIFPYITKCWIRYDRQLQHPSPNGAVPGRWIVQSTADSIGPIPPYIPPEDPPPREPPPVIEEEEEIINTTTGGGAGGAGGSGGSGDGDGDGEPVPEGERFPDDDEIPPENPSAAGRKCPAGTKWNGVRCVPITTGGAITDDEIDELNYTGLVGVPDQGHVIKGFAGYALVCADDRLLDEIQWVANPPLEKVREYQGSPQAAAQMRQFGVYQSGNQYLVRNGSATILANSGILIAPSEFTSENTYDTDKTVESGQPYFALHREVCFAMGQPTRDGTIVSGATLEIDSSGNLAINLLDASGSVDNTKTVTVNGVSFTDLAWTQEAENANFTAVNNTLYYVDTGSGDVTIDLTGLSAGQRFDVAFSNATNDIILDDNSSAINIAGTGADYNLKLNGSLVVNGIATIRMTSATTAEVCVCNSPGGG